MLLHCIAFKSGAGCFVTAFLSGILTVAWCELQLRMYRVVWFYQWCEYSSNIKLLWLTLFRNMSVRRLFILPCMFLVFLSMCYRLFDAAIFVPQLQPYCEVLQCCHNQS